MVLDTGRGIDFGIAIAADMITAFHHADFAAKHSGRTLRNGCAIKARSDDDHVVVAQRHRKTSLSRSPVKPAAQSPQQKARSASKGPQYKARSASKGPQHKARSASKGPG